jgi:molybdate transport system substrate-binding protein
MKKLLSLWLLLAQLHAVEIKIAVAANVSYAMDELKKVFHEMHPETKVQVTLGSSGKLTAQIMNGAPYELFMAANMMYPESLYTKGKAITKPLIYAKGSLAYLSSVKPDFSKGIGLVEEEKIKRVAIANPKTAPYGKAAMEALKNGGVYEKIKHKIIFAESVSQTVTYAITAAELGFIARSSLYSAKMSRFKEGVDWSAVDPQLYTPIDQGIVILKEGEGDTEVKAFYDFMLSPKAKEILQRYGYLVP